MENWWLIFHDVSYFVAAGRPPLLRHVWSLAVEEQFYLFWPLILALLLRIWGHDRRKVIGAVLGLALFSAVSMAVLYTPYTDPSRVYFGTDTRASTMLIGAALAFVWSPWRLTRNTGKGAPLVLDAFAVVGLLGVVWFFLNAGEFDPWMYRGGFTVIALFTALLLAGTVHPAARLAPAVFGLGFLRWIGVRSYGIYLWHWPIFMVTRPHSDLPITGIPLAGAAPRAHDRRRGVVVPLRGGTDPRRRDRPSGRGVPGRVGGATASDGEGLRHRRWRGGRVAADRDGRARRRRFHQSAVRVAECRGGRAGPDRHDLGRQRPWVHHHDHARHCHHGAVDHADHACSRSATR